MSSRFLCRLARHQKLVKPTLFTPKSTPIFSTRYASGFHTSRSILSEAEAQTTPAEIPEITSPKVQSIYDGVLELNIMETIELVDVLKAKFGYVEQAFVAGPAAGGGGGAAAEEAVEEVVAKTEFTLRLDAFDDKSKIKVIKEVRAFTGLGLKQAKELVESAPKAVIKENVPKEEAEKLKTQFEAIGGTLVLE
jgi:large subunit ribosomal protein L7/L12